MFRFLRKLLILFFILFFLSLYVSYPEDNVSFKSKVSYNGYIGLHDNDQENSFVDYSSFINTAYVEMYYSEHDMLEVQFDTSLHKQINNGYINSLDLSGFDNISISAYSPHFIVVDDGDSSEFWQKVVTLSNNEVISNVNIYI